MNRTLLIAATALVASGCVADSPLYVTGIFPFDTECKIEPGETRQYSGSLDLSGSGGYLLIADLQSDLDPTLDTKGDLQTLVTGVQRNTVILDQISLTYTSVPSSLVLESENVPITIVAAPGSVQHVGMDLFGPKAYEKLLTSLPNAGDRADIRIGFTFRGNLNSGGRISSTPITFPITVYRSGATCPAGEQFVRTGVCGRIGGQDNARLCCSGDATCLPAAK
jgi:hypothetical protein